MLWGIISFFSFQFHHCDFSENTCLVMVAMQFALSGPLDLSESFLHVRTTSCYSVNFHTSVTGGVFKLSYLLNEKISRHEPLANISSDSPDSYSSVILSVFLPFFNESHLFEGRKSVLRLDFFRFQTLEISFFSLVISPIVHQSLLIVTVKKWYRCSKQI